MKNVLFFVAIITVCGSLTKPSLGRCTPKIKAMYYMKGKLVKISAKDWYSQWMHPIPAKCWNDEMSKYILADSVSYTITH